MSENFGEDIEILSMEVDSMEDSPEESLYRVRVDNRVRYLTIAPGTFPYETLRFPFNLLPRLPALPSGDWTNGYIFRKEDEVSFEISDGTLPAVESVWSPQVVEVLSLESPEYLSSIRTTEVVYGSSTAVAKIARFPFEIDRIDNETSCYYALDGKDIAPRFLAHIAEHGRVMGILIEKLEGRYVGIEDLGACTKVVKEMHALGLCHGDLNRYNFVVSDDGVKLIDFENAFEGSSEEMEEELASLPEQLQEETGRGTTLACDEDGDDLEDTLEGSHEEEVVRS